jgi:hypothetical protein
VRNTAPIGWILLLILKAFQLNSPSRIFLNYILGFIMIFMPLVTTATYADSLWYGELKIVPWNFLKVNLLEGHS